MIARLRTGVEPGQVEAALTTAPPVEGAAAEGEWVDVFVLRPLAIHAPAGLEALEEAEGLDLYDLGALIPISVFALGWLLFAAVTLRSGMVSRLAAWSVIAGFFLTPIFTAAMGLWGAGLGNAVLGAGWVWLGVEVWRGHGAAIPARDDAAVSLP